MKKKKIINDDNNKVTRIKNTTIYIIIYIFHRNTRV